LRNYMSFIETIIIVLAKFSHKYRLIFARNLTLFLGSDAAFGGLAIMIFSLFVFCIRFAFFPESKISNITHIFLNQRRFCSILVFLLNNNVHSKSLAFSRNDEV
jgi:hypothetical protein